MRICDIVWCVLHVSIFHYFPFFSPPARRGLLDLSRFIVRICQTCGCSFLLSFLPCFLPRRASSASSSSQWASPDLSCQLLIAVGLAGSQLPALDRSGCQLWNAVSLAGLPLPALDRSGLRHASPDLHCQLSIAGPRRTSTGERRSALGSPDPSGPKTLWASSEIRSAMGLAGPQPDHRTSTARNKAIWNALECIRMPKRMPYRMPDRMSEDLPIFAR